MALALQPAPSPASSILIGRDASFMSVSPLQNFLNPPPVPANATVTLTPEFAFWNSSATASVIGYTVLEPSMLTLPDKAPVDDWAAVVTVAAAELPPTFEVVLGLAPALHPAARSPTRTMAAPLRRA